MRFSVGPSYRSYVIGQFIVIPGLLLTTHMLVGRERNFFYIMFLASVSILIMGLAAWRKNDPLRAAGMTSFMTATLFTLFHWATRALSLLPEIRSFASLNPVEFGIGIFSLVVVVGFVIVAVWQVVCGAVHLFPDRWATPLWGQRRVVGTPKIRILRYPGVGEK